MKQVTITYTRAVTVTVPDDCPMGPEELVGCVDNLSNVELEDYGIDVVGDENLSFTSCTTNI